jgi:hypothetical protein
MHPMLTAKELDLFPADLTCWEQDAATVCRNMRITHDELLALMRRAGLRFSRVTNSVGWINADAMIRLSERCTLEEAFGPDVSPE